jgi:hypothetical protein
MKAVWANHPQMEPDECHATHYNDHGASRRVYSDRRGCFTTCASCMAKLNVSLTSRHTSLQGPDICVHACMRSPKAASNNHASQLPGCACVQYPVALAGSLSCLVVTITLIPHYLQCNARTLNRIHSNNTWCFQHSNVGTDEQMCLTYHKAAITLHTTCICCAFSTPSQLGSMLRSAAPAGQYHFQPCWHAWHCVQQLHSMVHACYSGQLPRLVQHEASKRQVLAEEVQMGVVVVHQHQES